jgi:hypothetical protein
MKIHGAVAASAVALCSSMASAQSPSPNNAVWGVNDQNEVLRYNPYQSAFERVPGTLTQLSIGSDGEVWGIDPTGNVLRWTGSEWKAHDGNLRQISVRNLKEAWGVNAENDLLRWNQSSWEPTGFKTNVVSAGIDGTVWGLATEAGGGVVQTISTWLAEQRLVPIVSTGSHLKQLSVTDANRVWVIDDNGQSFRGNGEVEWQRQDPGLKDVVEAPNGEVWKLYSNGSLRFIQEPSAPQSKTFGGQHFNRIAVGYSGLTDDERQRTLDAHNNERQKYPGVGPLQWSRELEAYAQQWAQLVASGEASGHRPGRQDNPFKPGEVVGENMYGEGPAQGVTGVNAVNWFISEKQWYHYDQDDGKGQPPGCTAPAENSCGHFTQVIWKDTQYVGCGTAVSTKNQKWYVCNYYPPGNWNYKKPY